MADANRDIPRREFLKKFAPLLGLGLGGGTLAAIGIGRRKRSGAEYASSDGKRKESLLPKANENDPESVKASFEAIIGLVKKDSLLQIPPEGNIFFDKSAHGTQTSYLNFRRNEDGTYTVGMPYTFYRPAYLPPNHDEWNGRDMTVPTFLDVLQVGLDSLERFDFRKFSVSTNIGQEQLTSMVRTEEGGNFESYIPFMDLLCETVAPVPKPAESNIKLFYSISLSSAGESFGPLYFDYFRAHTDDQSEEHYQPSFVELMWSEKTGNNFRIVDTRDPSKPMGTESKVSPKDNPALREVGVELQKLIFMLAAQNEALRGHFEEYKDQKAV